jgi:DNA polymerase-4
VVLAASYEAKAYGVRGGMGGRRARQLCPDLLFVSGHFSEYQRLGDQVIEILNDFTPLVERISIDEAFLDVGGSVHLFGPPAEIGGEIRSRVRTEAGLPVSVGVARTKHLAKIASQVAKPDGLIVVEPEVELDFLHPLPVELMWGVGPVTQARLAEKGIWTIGDLAAAPGQSLEHLLGRAVGSKLGSLAWNRDPRAIRIEHRAGSVGAQSALGRQAIAQELIGRTLRHLADRVATRLRAKERAGKTVTVRVRFAEMQSVTRSVTLPAAISATPILAEVSRALVETALNDHPDQEIITLLAISVSQLVYEPALQLELPMELGHDEQRPGTAAGAARWALDRSVDAVRDRFGRKAVGYASVALSELGAVPDEFRELAEKD